MEAPVFVGNVLQKQDITLVPCLNWLLLTECNNRAYEMAFCGSLYCMCMTARVVE